MSGLAGHLVPMLGCGSLLFEPALSNASRSLAGTLKQILI